MDNHTIENIFNKHFGKTPTKIKRLPTGYGNYVYKVDLDSNSTYIIRMNTVENVTYLKGSIYWLEKLKSLDIPIPKVLVNGIENEIPFVILNYIPGDDLGKVYEDLTEEQKKNIVQDLISIQNKVDTMPKAKGYGYLSTYEDPNYKSSWKEVIEEHLERSKKQMKENDFFDYSLVEEVEKLLVNFDDYFESIEPVPFLDDISNKNVLIHNGQLSSIIDLDWLCFGDKLYVLALTNMALLSQNVDTNYVKYWAEGLDLNDKQKRILNLYTLIFCVDFMSEKGMTFNKEVPIPVSQEEIKFLNNIYETLIT